jgi:HK97 family phage portal protein
LELSVKIGKKTYNLFGGKKAFQNIADSDNELYRRIFDMLGGEVTLHNYSAADAIKKGYIVNPHLYTVINRKIKPASKVPFYLYEEKKGKAKEVGRYKAAMEAGNFNEAEELQKKAFDLIEIKEINEMLQNPNENESFTEWLESLLGYYNLTGNGYTYGLNPEGYGDGYFSKIYTMPSQMTQIVTGSSWREPIKGYSVNWYGLGVTPIDRRHVCHIKNWNPETDNINRGLYGLSPLAPLCKVNQNSNDNFTAQMRLLQHGYPAGILSGDSERGMTPEKAKIVEERFEERFGHGNQKKIMLSTQKLNWQALGLNSVDMELLSSDLANLKTYARVYRVPTALVSDEASTMDNMKVASISLWNDAIIPDLARVRDDVFNKWYLAYWKQKTGKKLYIDYDLGTVEALKKDDKLVMEVIALEMENGIITPNMAREKRGYELATDPLMDKFYLKQGLRPIDQPHANPNTQKEDEKKPKE